MAKKPNQKLKLALLAKLFWEQSDEAHPIRTADMIRYLAANGVSAERKSLYDDLEALQLLGMDIVSTGTGRTTGYFLASRLFELYEARLLADAVQSSRFLTAKKSKELIGKIASLLSRHEAKELGHSVFVANRIKSMNESIYINVNLLESAMENDRQIAFQYYDWDSRGKRILRHDGAFYRVSPFHLAWNNENYYLIGFDENRREIRHFRVDKMKSLSEKEEARTGKDSFVDFDPAVYTQRIFSMYGGREETVTIFCRKELVGAMIDRFGEGLVFRQRQDGVEFTVPVEVSPVFFAFLMSFGAKVRLEAPAAVRAEMKTFTEEILKQYGGTDEET